MKKLQYAYAYYDKDMKPVKSFKKAQIIEEADFTASPPKSIWCYIIDHAKRPPGLPETIDHYFASQTRIPLEDTGDDDTAIKEIEKILKR